MNNNKQSRVDLEFVPDEEALALKELGFSEPCYKYIYIGDTGNNIDLKLEVEPSEAENFNSESLCVSRPTFSQAFRWFREKYNLHYFIDVSDGVWFFDRWSFDGYKTYEEAELACLRKLIEIANEQQ